MGAHTEVWQSPILPLSEQELFLRARAGNKEAREELAGRVEDWVPPSIFRWYKNPTWRDDVGQVGVDKVIAELPAYDPARGPFRPWAHRIARNAALNEIRKRKLNKNVVSFEDIKDESPFSVADPAEHYRDYRVKEAVSRLKPELRKVACLRFLEEMEIEAIAEELHLKKRQVRYRVELARKALRERLAYVAA